MAGRQRGGAKLARGGQKVAELHQAVALDAGHRRLARGIAVREILDHGFAETAFIIQHIVRNAETLGNVAGVMDVLTGTAGALTMGGRAVIVELQGYSNDIVTLGLQQRGRHRRIDTARHGDHDPRILRTAFQIQTVEH